MSPTVLSHQSTRTLPRVSLHDAETHRITPYCWDSLKIRRKAHVNSPDLCDCMHTIGVDTQASDKVIPHLDVRNYVFSLDSSIGAR